MKRLFGLVLVACLPLVGHEAAAEQICVEQAAGVCLKYRTVEPRKSAPAPAQPSRPSGPRFSATPEAEAEKDLNLDRNEYRFVQAGLKKAGYYDGPLDGVMGGGSRSALAAWQADNGISATGYLTFDQVIALQNAPKPSATKIAEPPSGAPAQDTTPSDNLPPLGREHVARFSNRDPVAGGDVIVTATRISETTVKLSVKVQNATIASFNFSDTCDTPVSGGFTCQIQTRNSGAWQVNGEYPDIVVDGKAVSLW